MGVCGGFVFATNRSSFENRPRVREEVTRAKNRLRFSLCCRQCVAGKRPSEGRTPAAGSEGLWPDELLYS